MADASDPVRALTPCHTPPAGRRSRRLVVISRLHSSKPSLERAFKISSGAASHPRSRSIHVILPCSRSSLRPLIRSISRSLLDRAEPPRVGPDRAGKRPVLLKLHGFGLSPFYHVVAALVHPVIEQVGQEANGDEVLPALLPGVGHFHRANSDVLQPVHAALGSELVTLLLKGRMRRGGRAGCRSARPGRNRQSHP